MDAYVDTRARADLADTALCRMLRDVRLPVPNSIRIPNDQCFELVPTSGGSERCKPSGTCSAPLEPEQAVTAIDTSCPAVAGAALLATHIRSCTFIYDPNQGATQQSGLIWMELAIARNNEMAHLSVGAHVQNAP